ncbi:MGMT family protein, partial [Pseudomonas aeruginosa]|nr:DNA base-flipping protein YbaZ [Pseudomonas aeruginosa]MCR3824837.1 DNA base-flipping protein YbaZ [Pseudomonas aeruginosa]
MGVHKADRKGKTDEHAWAGSDPASAQARREALYLVL